jgi:3',5'-cyclic AMP phosphodiesterase CpdA
MSIRLRGTRGLVTGAEGGIEIGKLERADHLGPGPEGGIRIGHLSDFHLGEPVDRASVPERIESWLDAFREAGVDAVVYSGDLVEEPDDRVGMLRVRYLLEHSGIPWVVVPGNHDVARPGEESPFYELFGSYPRVERIAGAEFILLDSFGALPLTDRGPFDRLDARETGAYSKGRVGNRQLAAVEARLAPASDRPRLLVLHHHLAAEEEVVDEPSGSSVPDALMVPCLDAEAVLDWAGRFDVVAAFHGHMHAHWPPFVPTEGPVVFNSGSSTRGKPDPRARIVDIETGGRGTVWELEVEGSGVAS